MKEKIIKKGKKYKLIEIKTPRETMYSVRRKGILGSSLLGGGAWSEVGETAFVRVGKKESQDIFKKYEKYAKRKKRKRCVIKKWINRQK